MRVSVTLPPPLQRRLDLMRDCTGLGYGELIRSLIAQHAPELPPAPKAAAKPRAKRTRAPSIGRADIAAVVAAYRDACTTVGLPDLQLLDDGAPRSQTISDQIKKALRADPRRDWIALFRRVAASDFLTGRKTDFRASLTWIIKPANLAKIDAGAYDNNDGRRGAENAAPISEAFDF